MDETTRVRARVRRLLAMKRGMPEPADGSAGPGRPATNKTRKPRPASAIALNGRHVLPARTET